MDDKLKKQLVDLITRQRQPVPTLKNAKYCTAIVTFIDLLGFRNYISRRTARQVAQALNLFYYAGQESDTSKQKDVYIYAFSDSIVRVRLINRTTNTPKHYRISPLYVELSNLARIQFELACWYGLFIRGGISLGDIYVRNNMIFGPALIQAYDLESKYAVYPRILIDPKIFSSLHSSTDLYTKLNDDFKRLYAGGAEYADQDATSASLSDSIIQDGEGYIFLDYMNSLIKGADLSFLIGHSNVIRQAFSEAQSARTREKYTWLAHYHNFTMRTDINFQEIGLTPENIDKYSVTDLNILRTLTPKFKRIRRFSEVNIQELNPPIA